MKCLECAINRIFHTFSGGASVSSRLLPLVCVKWRVFSKQQLILTTFKRPGNLKEVASFKKQTELNPCTHTNVEAKVQPYQPSLLIVFPTQMLK